MATTPLSAENPTIESGSTGTVSGGLHTADGNASDDARNSSASVVAENTSPDSIWNSTPAAVGACVVLLIVALPWFLQLPLTNDAEYYDLQAQMVRDGGVLYQDMFEPNLPGVVWIHMAVRGLAGESLLVLRLFDLAVFGFTLSLIAAWLSHYGWSLPRRIWLTAGLLTFYLSLSTWCYCQRDVWMLAPVLLALTLRAGQLRRQQTAVVPRNRTVWLAACLEGIVWGAAVWLKPHAVFPAALVWLVSLRGFPDWKRRCLDFSGLVTGGLLAGVAGIGWLIAAGSWPAFVDTLLHWNPEYAATGREHWIASRVLTMFFAFWPWILLHIPAAILAVQQCWTALRHSPSDDPGVEVEQQKLRQPLIAACYLGWTLQAFLLQHLFHYIHVAPLVLAIFVIAGSLPSSWMTPDASDNSRTRNTSATAVKLCFYGMIVLIAIASPLLSSRRLANWTAAVTGNLTPAVADRVAILPTTEHQNLAKVEAFLLQQKVQGTEVACFNSELVSLYRRLGTQPPTRFVYTMECLVFLPSRRAEIYGEAGYRGVRFVVTDVASSHVSPEVREDILRQSRSGHPVILKDGKPRSFPLRYPVVFHAGRYFVHQVSAKSGTDN